MSESSVPSVSVVVPAHDGARVLPHSLRALRESRMQDRTWELIVVDDGSRDATADVAEHFADVVIRLGGGPHGPAYARNRGAERARGEYLVFIDADVCVHHDTVARLVETLQEDATLSAVFGAYDTAPVAPGVVSQYRNLLHHYVHWRHAGPARTFWAGCGAIRREAFLTAGMFDAERFPKAQIEDVELGYRMAVQGHRMLLAPDIQGTHLKRWTLGNIVRTDFAARAVPWMRLMLERRGETGPGTLNVTGGERLLTMLVGVAVIAAVAACITREWWYAVASLACLVTVVLANVPLFAWFARQRGVIFALITIPLRLMFYLVAGAGAGWAMLLHVLAARERHALFRGQRHEQPTG